MSKTFAELFKKYRLKAEYATLTSFGNALAEKGFFYEDSIFSHWQKATRIPTDRTVIIEIIKIFIEKGWIISTEEAHEFLASAKQGYLTKRELSAFLRHRN